MALMTALASPLDMGVEEAFPCSFTRTRYQPGLRELFPVIFLEDTLLMRSHPKRGSVEYLTVLICHKAAVFRACENYSDGSITVVIPLFVDFLRSVSCHAERVTDLLLCCHVLRKAIAQATQHSIRSR